MRAGFTLDDYEKLKDTLLKGGYNVDVHRVKRIPNSYDFMLVPMGRISSKDSAKLRLGRDAFHRVP
jgi:hypothetical protein